MDVMETERAAEPGPLAYTQLSERLSNSAKDFSLVAGGPLYQLLLRVKLVKPPFDRVAWRAVVITMIAWAPLLLLTALGGRLTSGVHIPFLRGLDAQIRFLLALPLLIAAELTVHRETRKMVVQFVDRQIIKPSALPRFEACITSALLLRNSAAAEIGLLALTLILGNLWWRGVLAIPTDSWYATIVDGKSVLTAAGYWYVFISLPIIQFIGFRWYYRLFIWVRLLWQTSRLNLNLVPSHPDRRCGLGFLGQIVLALAPFLMAHRVVLSGFVSVRILYEGSKLSDFGIEIAAVAGFLFLISLGPLFVFTPGLLQRRKEGVYIYGCLASEYVNEFERKWLQGQRPANETLVGTSDIQSLADLTNSFAVVQHIVPFPFGREAIFSLAALIALPILPLLLTMFSARELIGGLLKVLF